MGLVQLTRISAIPAKGNPAGLVQLLPLTPSADRGLTFGRSLDRGIHVGKIPGYWTCPYDGTITGVILNTDQGGYTIKFWRNLMGRSPLAEDSININGYSITAPETHTEHYVLTDFVDFEVRAGDTFAVEITEVSNNPAPTDIAGNLLILKLEEEKK